CVCCVAIRHYEAIGGSRQLDRFWALFIMVDSPKMPRWRPWLIQELLRMPHVITEPCIGTKDTACVAVCPVDCIHPRKDEGNFEAATQLYINPDECIDCGACEPACPVAAIFPEEEVPEKWKSFIQLNYDYFKK